MSEPALYCELVVVDGVAEAVLVDRSATLVQLATIGRLIGPGAVIDPVLGQLWHEFVVCSRSYSEFHRGKLTAERPRGVRMYLGAHE